MPETDALYNRPPPTSRQALCRRAVEADHANTSEVIRDALRVWLGTA